MFMRVFCFQKNTGFLGCEKIFFPYTQKGSFFCNGAGGFLTADGPGCGRRMTGRGSWWYRRNAPAFSNFEITYEKKQRPCLLKLHQPTADSRVDPMMTDKTMIKTVERHFLERKGRNPHATTEFCWLLSGITLACKIIAAQISRAGLLDIMGGTGEVNVQGEDVQKLDVIANQTLVRCLGYRGNIGLLVSEEDEEPHVISDSGDQGKYIVLFDPLDGSSNINANVNIGTIFSIMERPEKNGDGDVKANVLQPGCKQVAAGYVIYGSSTVLAYTAGFGV
ncbi:MAG: Inositol phosphatase/fructose6-bisphosphatase, partial [Pedosphaera sp.]|nr:Inositol phosphatase/fructose6-bisphosphatase [Pedosphaera sp.]